MATASSTRATVQRPGNGEDARRRLLAAMAESVSEKGYADTTVADVVRIARTSRRTFYEHFEDRADCFLALGDAIADQLMARVAQAASGDDAWRTRVDRAVGTYVQSMAENPGLARSFVLEMFGMGPRGLAHKREVLDRATRHLHDLIQTGREEHPELNPMSMETARALMAGIWELGLLTAYEDSTHTVDQIRATAAQLISDVLTAPR